ncbi:MAG: hypothetical protein ABH864_00100 [archaeon]
MRIGIDIDDVLMPTFRELLRNHNSKHGTSYNFEDIIDYRLWKIWGVTKEEAVEEVYSYQASEVFSKVKPFEGALGAIRKLKEKHDLVAITSRPVVVREQTLNWLNKHFEGIFDVVHFMEELPADGVPTEKSGKAKMCLDEGIDIMIEDAPQTAGDCAEVCKTVYLFDKPWNRSEQFNSNVVRVSGWEEVAELIK